MKTFWMFGPDLAQFGPYLELRGCSVLNHIEMRQARLPAGQFAPDRPPTAQLKFANEDFDLDCFPWGEFTFVSEKMRQVMALGPSEVQYFDVDATRSAPLPQSMHYQIMHVPVMEDVSDPKRSGYTTQESPGDSEVVGTPSIVAFRPGAQPQHEIFYDRFFKVVYCTDAFALRLLQADCSGIRFFDPADWRDRRFRTLRGIEQEEWDRRRKIMYEKVVEIFPGN